MVSAAQKTSSDEPQEDGGRRLATLISLSHIINLEADLLKPVLLHPENCKLLETLEKIPPRTQHHRAQAPQWAPTVVELSRQMFLVSGLSREANASMR